MRATCSEETLFVWVPTLLLGILTAIEMHKLVKNQKMFQKNDHGNGNTTKNFGVLGRHPLPLTIFFIAKMVGDMFYFTVKYNFFLLFFLDIDQLYYFSSNE